MRERPDDKRVTKTIRTIHAAFEQMMCEMDYSQITVKELCERALINKKTFYRYYETMGYLLAEFQESMMAGYLARVAGLRIPEDLEAITHEFFAFAQERGEVFAPIARNRRFRFPPRRVCVMPSNTACPGNVFANTVDTRHKRLPSLFAAISRVFLSSENFAFEWTLHDLEARLPWLSCP